ncbi:hypothetical protein N7491_002390 [Penicillium cf. griseofulvum]|uniref:Uncharacterized protein n=1 Tax=Penicillium cf. griseofulvum TaxID=2972120 RepID=A0A9W9MT80_9EURO|nr:hypothetical protein N7472_003427 [Penicillium cf. griseofulvum]KAJ5446308.1 hypothetical protein N7491_002390 [Penicillium cf. griseofulvum]KAJ5448051.1 hypothetical protein N7445_002872 [Penicillium cf. griseofulvum]
MGDCKLINMHSNQSDEIDVPSYACIQFECCRADYLEDAFMRVYVQVPLTRSEHGDRATRAK